MIYAFDLDSTLTKIETLPFVAKKLNIIKEYEEILRSTKNLPYEASLKKRLALFKSFPDEEISNILSEVPIFKNLQNFIQKNVRNACIITSNLDVYSEKLIKKIGCENVYASAFKNGETVLINKEKIVSYLKTKDKVTFTGDGDNDAKALKLADFSIAASYAKKASIKAIKVAKYEANTEDEVLELLQRYI